MIMTGITIPTTLDIPSLADIVHKCFVYARDNLHFPQERCDEWLSKGMILRGYLTELLAADFSKSLPTEVAAANEKLKAIKIKIEDSSKALANYSKAIQDLISLTEILTKLIVIVHRPVSLITEGS
jgi:hypothetical protein